MPTTQAGATSSTSSGEPTTTTSTTGSSESTPPTQGEPGGASNNANAETANTTDPNSETVSRAEYTALEAKLNEALSKIEEARGESIAERNTRKSLMEEQGQFKELLEEQTKEMATLTAERDDLRSKLDTAYKELKGYRDERETRRSALLEKFPEDDRTRYADAERWPLSEIEYLYEKYHKENGKERRITDDPASRKTSADQPKELRDILAEKMGMGRV